MCGIAGILRLSDRPLPPPEVIRRMIGSIAYRGPDDSGEFLDEHVALAAVRLSILDLQSGGQPAHSASGRSVAIHNGEIYNFKQLGAELKRRGHALPSQGDTIVLPYLYEELGVGLTARLHGMYAFAIWDRAERRLLLGRDRLGIKPLYLARTPDFLLFASEIKALLASGLIRAEIDRDALDDLFSMSYPCPPRTLFRGVEELRPAHRLVADAKRRTLTLERYWRAPFAARGEHRRIARRDAEVEFRERLRATVADHLQADVPVAALLSGGLDSSAIAALIREVRGEPPTTFSIGFATPEHDERSSASEVARALGAENLAIECGPQTAEHYPDVVYHTELPLQFPLALPLTRLSALVRERGFPVALTGEGADELLAGYDCFRAERLRRLLDRPLLRALKPALYRQLYSWLGSPQGLEQFLIEVQSGSAAAVEARFGGVRPAWYDAWHALEIDRHLLLSPDMRSVRPVDLAPPGFASLVREDIGELHPLDAALALELETRLPSWILLIGDRASMANGVEARVPFLDHELVEWVVSLPPSYKLRGLTEKSLLRGAMRGLLPESIRRRQKRPFYTPIKEWFFARERPAYVDALLSDRALRDAGLFDSKSVARLREQLGQVPHGHFMRLRLEWILVLVLGTQILHHHFVAPGMRAAATRPGAREGLAA
jgi:asparagine synthase (glutamine-hydrolysing)